MKKTIPFEIAMLAPCGINCTVCYVHLRAKKPCAGCRSNGDGMPQHCRVCRIKDCALGRGVEFCSECSEYPCKIIKRLDKSYRQRYQFSLIESALRLKADGAEVFLQDEQKRWICGYCGGLISLHDQICSECGAAPEVTGDRHSSG